MQDNVRLPIELKAVDCKNISEDDAKQIDISLNQLRKDLDEIQQEVNSL